jgi:hypothetical protein
MRVRPREQTISENLALYEVSARELKKIRRGLLKLEWAYRWRRIKQWLKM